MTNFWYCPEIEINYVHLTCSGYIASSFNSSNQPLETSNMPKRIQLQIPHTSSICSLVSCSGSSSSRKRRDPIHDRADGSRSIRQHKPSGHILQLVHLHYVHRHSYKLHSHSVRRGQRELDVGLQPLRCGQRRWPSRFLVREPVLSPCQAAGEPV